MRRKTNLSNFTVKIEGNAVSKYIVELSQADDPRKKASWCECNIESDTPIPIAAVGDTIYARDFGAKSILRVERRHFSYFEGWTHVQLFCREVSEGEI